MATKFTIDQTKREALNKDKAHDLLRELDGEITSVKLSGKSFGDGSAQVVADALERISTTLTHLDISDIIASRPEDEAKRTLSTIAEGLKSCKHLIYLDLSDNALGAKGIRAVGEMIDKQTQLAHLYLCNNGLAADAGNLITQALIPSERDRTDVSTKLKTLHFHNNLLETAGAIALAPIIENSPELSDFRFSSLRLGREGAVHMCKVLTPRASTTLKKLNLSDNSFAGDEAAEALATCLSDAPFLESLVINDCLLGDDGVSRLCDALVEGAPKLEVFDVSANEVGAEGAKGLARLVAVGRLVDVKAEDNELGNVGAKRLAVGLSKSATIRNLDVSGCEIKSKGALAIGLAIVLKSTLSLLNMDRNCISQETVDELEKVLEDKLAPMEDNEDEDEDDEDDEDEEDEDEDDGDEADTDKAVTCGDTAEHVDINPEDEGLDNLISQVKKLSF